MAIPIEASPGVSEENGSLLFIIVAPGTLLRAGGGGAWEGLEGTEDNGVGESGLAKGSKAFPGLGGLGGGAALATLPLLLLLTAVPCPRSRSVGKWTLDDEGWG